MKTRYNRPHPENGITINVQVTPGAREDAIAGRAGDRIKIRIRARAVEGAANDALVLYLAELFGVAKSRVTIVRGHASRLKSIAIEGERSVLENKLASVLNAVRDS